MALTLPVLKRAPRRPRSQQERLWLIGGAIAGFVLLLIGYFFLISPQRSETSSLTSQLATERQQNAVLQARMASLREQNKNLATYQAAYSQALKALPSTSGVSDFLRSLQSLGNATLTDVSQLTVGQPASVSAPAAPGNNGAAPATGSTGSPSAAAATGTPTPGAAAPGAPSGQVFALTITATVSGSPASLGKFLDQLQHVQPRAVLITGLTQAAAGTSVAGTSGAGRGTQAATTLQLTMQAFVAPTNPAEAAALAPAGGR